MKPIELWHGDCLELMKNIPDGSVDLVLTDPPYGTTACKWDSVIPFEPMWEQLNRIIKPNGAICLFGSEPFSSALRMRAHGDVESHPRKNTNTFRVQDDKVYCLTAKGQRYVIDFCDLEKVKKYSWCLSKTGYFVANIQGKVTKLHRFILQAGDGEVVDHIDGNPANNSKSNLRICSLSENAKSSR